ncbi:MAG: ABC transporter ATP-binding protein [Armatimonadetes bacterium]|jgi:ABC-2 type transport system ATP-binding protein|nr:ABC transporter ATP-binding protein [Armatimonadota bacterium]
MNVATINNLTVRYGAKTAIEDLTADIPEGCVGLLGPNGAGKTTLLKTLMGFLKPAKGGGSVMDCRFDTQGLRIRQLTGLMPEQDCHIPGLSAVEFVAYAGELAGMPREQAMRRSHEVLEYAGLGEARYRPVETYSTGMKQRIKLAQALVHGPKLIFLDEPTNGLDPDGRDEMLALVRDISHGKGVNVVVSSHLLPDIERTCDTVIVMANGRVVEQGEISTLKQVAQKQVAVELRIASDEFVSALEARGARLLSAQGSHYRFALMDHEDDIGRLLFETAKASGAQIRGFHPALRSLEDIFLEAVQ